MKMKRWICLLLISVLLLSIVSGCKPANQDFSVDDELATTDTPTKDDQQTPDDSKPDNEQPTEQQKPDNDTPSTPDDPEDQKEPNSQPDTPKDPDSDPQPGTPSEPDDNPQPDQDQNEEWVKIEKENSGLPITFLMQNIFHGGNDTPEVSAKDQYKLGNRMSRFRTMVQKHDPDIIFAQESRTGQIEFFTNDNYMSQIYNTVYHYRMESMADAGGLQAEPVLYKKDKFTELDKGYFWLSSTPNRPSVSFDSTAKTGHICNWVKLKEKKTGIVLYAYCVHIDPYGKSCPYESMQLFYQKVAEAKEDEYVFLGGDYNVIYRNKYYEQMMDDWSKVCDFRDMAMYLYKDGLCELGGMGSSKNPAERNERPTCNATDGQIDYLMGKPMPNMTIDYYGFDYTVYDGKADNVPEGHISDHWGLVVKMRIDTKVDYSQYQRAPYDYGSGDVYFNAKMND